MKKLFLMLSVLFLSFACSTLSPEADPTLEPASETTVTDPAKPIEVQAGETFTIVIDSNPSTGYHWEIVGALNENVALFNSRDYVADQPVLTGSGGVDVWTFQAVSVGETTVTLGSYPPYDAPEPEQTVTFTIVVK